MLKPTNEKVFELEMWIKGLSAIFQIENLPLSTYEKEHASLYNFRSHLPCIRGVLVKINNLLNETMDLDKYHFTQFLFYIQKIEPEESISSEGLHGEIILAMERIEDLERITTELSNLSFISYQSYLSLGRIIQDFLKQHLSLSKIFKGEAKPSWGNINHEAIKEHLKIIKKKENSKNILTLLVAFIKTLRYLEIIEEYIKDQRDYYPIISIFCLLNNQLQKITSYTKSILYSMFEKDKGVLSCLDSTLFSSKMEMKKVMELELVDVTVLLDPKLIRAKLEDSLGILRDLFQQNFVYLTETFSLKEVKGTELFPYYQNRKEQSLKLMEDMKKLSKELEKFKDTGSRNDFQNFYETLLNFQNKTMKYLMFKDWEPVERFISDFKNSLSLKQKEILAHQFDVFLKTLIDMVSKRSVLKE